MQAIVNICENGGIGRDGQLLVSLRQDLRRFARLTAGGTVIYGRKTLQTFPGGQPLKNRTNLLLSTTAQPVPGLQVFRETAELRRYLVLHGLMGRAWVVGGQSVYRALLDWCSRLELTETQGSFAADAFFPKPGAGQGWELAAFSGPLHEGGQSFCYKTLLRRQSAVVFDLDGTLWDATGQILPAWNRVLAEYGRTIAPEEFCGFMGKTAAELARLVLPGLPPQEGTAVVDRCCREQLSDLAVCPGRLYPGVREMLHTLARSHRLMLVSNCQDGYVQAFLDAHNLWDCFEDVEMHGRTGLSKAENIRLVLRRSGIQRAVYVGDTPADAEAARQAGIDFIWAGYGFGPRPDCRAEALSPADLPARIS